MNFRRGDLLWIRCDPSLGSEPRKTRTCVVVSSDHANAGAAWRGVTVVVTRKYDSADAWRPFLVDLRAPRSTLSDHRFANCSQIMTYDRDRIAKAAGRVSPEALRAIDRALRLHLALDPDPFVSHEPLSEYQSDAADSPDPVPSRRPRTRRKSQSRRPPPT